jgi:hypothetical protein
MSDDPGYIGTRPDPVPPEHYTVAGVLAGKTPVRLPHHRDGYENAPTSPEPQPMPRPATPKPLKPRGPESQPQGEDGPPPKTGKGSSADAWAIYASAKGVTVELDAKREDIIDACEKAGVPTE